MNNFNFYITDDNSVGLYSEEVHDIYHSRTGALKESFDKFILPTNFQNFCKTNEKIRILDICYGIGYNTKSAIYSFLNAEKNNFLEINALEISKETAFLSPFVNDALNCPEINLYLLANFIYCYNSEFLSYIKDVCINEMSQNPIIYSQDLCLVFKTYVSARCKNMPFAELNRFLHNIYYQNISKSMKIPAKPPYFDNIKINYYFDDARNAIQEIREPHDFVFHDGFTPHKQPLLWSIDFFKVLKTILQPNGIIATYSNSTPVRSALYDLGFNLGKVILDGKQFGTIASLNPKNILYPLNSFEYGMLETKSGIPYRDEYLNLSSREILKNRDNIVRNSNKLSLTAYKRNLKNE